MKIMEPIQGMFGIPRTLFGKIGNNRLWFDVVVFFVYVMCCDVWRLYSYCDVVFTSRFVGAQRCIIAAAAADSHIAAAVGESEVGTCMLCCVYQYDINAHCIHSTTHMPKYDIHTHIMYVGAGVNRRIIDPHSSNYQYNWYQIISIV